MAAKYGPALPGATWIICTAINRSAGSIQKYVPHTPFQVKLPIDPGTLLDVGSVRIAKPSPQIEPRLGPIASPTNRMPGGNEFVVISCTVFADKIRTPSCSPPLSSIWQKRK